MFVGYRHCKKCGKPLMGLFDGAVCDECEKAEQEPKSIIREAIEDYVCNYLTDTAKAQKILNALQDMEHEPIECDDAISRQAVLSEKIYTETEGWSGYTVDADYIEHLPSVTQKSDEQLYKNGFADGYEQGYKDAEQKSGKWIDYREDGFVECPFCGHATNCEDDIDELHYCFYCGARMVKEQESEVAE